MDDTTPLTHQPRSTYICLVEALKDFDSDDCEVLECMTTPHDVPEAAFASAIDDLNSWFPTLFPDVPKDDLFLAPIALADARAAAGSADYFNVPLPASLAADQVHILWPELHEAWDND